MKSPFYVYFAPYGWASFLGIWYKWKQLRNNRVKYDRFYSK